MHISIYLYLFSIITDIIKITVYKLLCT